LYKPNFKGLCYSAPGSGQNKNKQLDMMSAALFYCKNIDTVFGTATKKYPSPHSAHCPGNKFFVGINAVTRSYPKNGNALTTRRKTEPQPDSAFYREL
jgi:hypothetical protein